MVLIEKGGADPAERQALAGMFRARKRIFVDLLKWDIPVLGGEFELDEFDTEQAIYILVEGDDGRHLASARLLPTERPHILDSLFPCLVAGEIPRGPKIFEITRFCLDPNRPARERRIARNRLVSGLVNFALERDVRTYTGVAELGWFQQILAFGWDCRPLGAPQRLACGTLGALAIEITPGTPALLARNAIWTNGENAVPTLAEAA